MTPVRVQPSAETWSRIPAGYQFSKIPNECPATFKPVPVLSPLNFLASRHRTASLSTATQTDGAAFQDAATQTDVIAPEEQSEHVSDAIGPRDSTANSRHLFGDAVFSASSSSSPDPYVHASLTRTLGEVQSPGRNNLRPGRDATILLELEQPGFSLRLLDIADQLLALRDLNRRAGTSHGTLSEAINECHQRGLFAATERDAMLRINTRANHAKHVGLT